MGRNMPNLYDGFAFLQPFAVAARYPYEIEFLPGDEERAIAAAERILTMCKALIESMIHGPKKSEDAEAKE